jgi:uncharacterized membrane protein SirB2
MRFLQMRWKPPQIRMATSIFVLVGIAVVIFNFLASSSGQRPWLIAVLFVSLIYLVAIGLFLFLVWKRR